MAIVVPQPGNDVSAELFGKPVADWINNETPTAWQPITVFQNGWSNYDGPAPAGRYLKWRKEGSVIRWTGCLKVPNNLITVTTTVCDIPPAAYATGAPNFVGTTLGKVSGVEILQGMKISAVPMWGSIDTYLFVDLSYAAI